MINSESSFFSRMLFNYPVHVYLTFPNAAFCAFCNLICCSCWIGGGRRKEGHTVCVLKAHLVDARPCVLRTSMWSWGPTWGERKGGIANLSPCSFWPSACLCFPRTALCYLRWLPREWGSGRGITLLWFPSKTMSVSGWQLSRILITLHLPVPSWPLAPELSICKHSIH